MFGAGGSGLITPRWDQTPPTSGANSPSHGARISAELSEQHINAAFNEQSAPLVSNS